MVVRIELRVHAGASSTRADDDRYRAQAEAYLANRHHVTTHWPASLGFATGIDVAGMRSDFIDPGETTVIHDPTVFVEDTQIAFTALESQIFPYIEPPTCIRPSRKRSITTSQAVTIPAMLPVIEVEGATDTCRTMSQSSYLKTPVLDRSSKKTCFDRMPKIPSVAGHNESFSAGAENGRLRIACLDGCSGVDEQTCKGASSEISHATNETTSELPTSYSLSNLASDSHKSGRRTPHRSASEVGPQSSRSDHQVGSGRGSSRASGADLGITTSGQEHNTFLTTVSARSTPHHTAETPVQCNQRKIRLGRALGYGHCPNTVARPEHAVLLDTDEANASHAKLQNISLSIRPPEPSPSIDGFTTHITPLLDRLAGLEVARAYKPVSIARELRVWERGHWALDLSSWSVELQIDFWQKLQEYIGKGSSGWGVWCTREASRGETNDAPFIGTIRVFCWGEVVQHIYLLLYSVSVSKVRSLGLQWIDAEDQVVVQMHRHGGAR